MSGSLRVFRVTQDYMAIFFGSMFGVVQVHSCGLRLENTTLSGMPISRSPQPQTERTGQQEIRITLHNESLYKAK